MKWNEEREKFENIIGEVENINEDLEWKLSKNES